MDKQLIADTLKHLRENSPKRNFKQSIDLIINLKDIDLKKPDHQINMFVTLHHDTGRKVSVCALVGPELEKNAKDCCDEVILAEHFHKFKDKRESKFLANKHDFFISQASVMPKVATTFGRFFGPKGKMPKIAAGDVKSEIEGLKQSIRIRIKDAPVVQCVVGKENMDDQKIAENIMSVVKHLETKLPKGRNNIKGFLLKLSMSKPVSLEVW